MDHVRAGAKAEPRPPAGLQRQRVKSTCVHQAHTLLSSFSALSHHHPAAQARRPIAPSSHQQRQDPRHRESAPSPALSLSLVSLPRAQPGPRQGRAQPGRSRRPPKQGQKPASLPSPSEVRGTPLLSVPKPWPNSAPRGRCRAAGRMWHRPEASGSGQGKRQRRRTLHLSTLSRPQLDLWAREARRRVPWQTEANLFRGASAPH